MGGGLLACKFERVADEQEGLFRYIVKDTLGKGSFGQVCKCSTSNPNYPGDVAVKIIKNHPAYFNQAKVEIGICYRVSSLCYLFCLRLCYSLMFFADNFCLSNSKNDEFEIGFEISLEWGASFWV